MSTWKLMELTEVCSFKSLTEKPSQTNNLMLQFKKPEKGEQTIPKLGEGRKS